MPAKRCRGGASVHAVGTSGRAHGALLQAVPRSPAVAAISGSQVTRFPSLLGNLVWEAPLAEVVQKHKNATSTGRYLDTTPAPGSRASLTAYPSGAWARGGGTMKQVVNIQIRRCYAVPPSSASAEMGPGCSVTKAQTLKGFTALSIHRFSHIVIFIRTKQFPLAL
jgi:hypothetical protein